jgi:hypothetical protein
MFRIILARQFIKLLNEIAYTNLTRECRIEII